MNINFSEIWFPDKDRRNVFQIKNEFYCSLLSRMLIQWIIPKAGETFKDRLDILRNVIDEYWKYAKTGMWKNFIFCHINKSFRQIVSSYAFVSLLLFTNNLNLVNSKQI